MKFSVEYVAENSPCNDGLLQAELLFERGVEYTIDEIIRSGANNEYIIWLLLKCSDVDVRVNEAIISGLNDCVVLSGCEYDGEITISSMEDCISCVAKRNIRHLGMTRDEAISWISSVIMKKVTDILC